MTLRKKYVPINAPKKSVFSSSFSVHIRSLRSMTICPVCVGIYRSRTLEIIFYSVSGISSMMTWVEVVMIIR